MLGSLRGKTRGFARLIAAPFAGVGFPPFLFTLLGPLLAVGSAYFIARQEFPEAFVLMLLAVSVDFFDGEVARLQKKESLFGNYFETVADKLVEAVLFIGASFLFPVASVFALAFSMLNSYAKPRVGLVIITDNRDWPAIGEHAERMLLLSLGILLSVFSIEFYGFKALEISLWLIAIISAIGFAQRIFYAKKLIKEAEQKGNVLPYLKK